MLKLADKRLEKIGFTKVIENNYIVSYERKVPVDNYTQRLDFCHKQNGNHLVQSYDKDLFDSKNIGNTSVGLNKYELKCCLRKLKELGW